MIPLREIEFSNEVKALWAIPRSREKSELESFTKVSAILFTVATALRNSHRGPDPTGLGDYFARSRRDQRQARLIIQSVILARAIWLGRRSAAPCPAGRGNLHRPRIAHSRGGSRNSRRMRGGAEGDTGRRVVTIRSSGGQRCGRRSQIP